jgi:peptide/nickel transport system substrate-binding protein
MNEMPLNEKQRESLWEKAQRAGMSRRTFLVLLGTSGAAAVLAACSSKSGITSSLTSTTRSTTGAGAPSGELRVAMSSLGIEQFNPILNGGSWNSPVVREMFDDLIGFSDIGGMGPGIAESWEMDPGGLSWTFHIRNGIKFHNGDDLTAEDVKFSMLAFNNRIPGQPEPGQTFDMGDVLKDVQVVDPYTVRALTNDIDVNFPLKVFINGDDTGMVMPQKYIQKVGWDVFGRQPVGSGPWKFVSQKMGDSISYEAVKNHWRKTPSYQNLTLMLVPEEPTRIAMLKTGSADIVEISDASTATVKAGGKWVAISPYSSQPAVFFFGVDYTDAEGGMTTPAIRDVRVRQALSLAINRDEIVQYILGDLGNVCKYPVAVFPYSPEVNFAALPSPEYNLAKAKQLLSDAGYANGFDISLIAGNFPGVPGGTKIAESVISYWGNVGVRAKIWPMDYASLRTLYRQKPTGLSMRGSAAAMRQTGDLNTANAVRATNTPEGSVHLVRNTQVSSLLKSVATQTDAAKRKQLLTQAVTIAYNTFCQIPIGYNSNAWGVSDKIKSMKTYAGWPYLTLSYETAVKA